MMTVIAAVLTSFSAFASIPSPPCSLEKANSVLFNDTDGSKEESYVEWKDGRHTSLDGFSAQCKGQEIARGKKKVPLTSNTMSELAALGCSFSFGEGSCLCEAPGKSAKFTCRSTGLRDLTEALKEKDVPAKKAKR